MADSRASSRVWGAGVSQGRTVKAPSPDAKMQNNVPLSEPVPEAPNVPRTASSGSA
eukprot:CAMPEP_0174372142 /NCGR_PEP_ID=MMETSP0811_2-20130205/102515_1 /TAXON_ID=73025 ORGANISM="Eutreptiella gymnastica-like, Strain CCMP1594" /NCGR_SAMPLE_ID=MMETSP0811_2 /ASSEMBLY_ACC=CAM_ASM_000667 /LENGTH=55 /DNA_ID=CAMNT_0015519257 /DNA_START=105 /DNA_END=269 /DNA_ORIENTATION=-